MSDNYQAIIKCDGCGKQEPMTFGHHSWHKPSHWYQRSDSDGVQVACSRECIEAVAARTGKSPVVLPI